MKRKILLALLLVAAICLTAFAAGPVMREAYGSVNGNSPNAAIVIDEDNVSYGEGFTGEMTVSANGKITSGEVSGVKIVGSGYDNGIVIRNTTGGTIAIGGQEINYDANGDWIKESNSAIIINGPANDPDVEGKYATPILVDAGEGASLVTVDNTFIKTIGYRAPTIISINSDCSVVFRNCWLETEGGEKSFMPNFKLLSGSTRTTCLMSENTWFYDSVIISKDWGAVSLDTTPYANVYMVNSYAESWAAGYGLYAVNGTTTRMYGSKMLASQYGMFLMGNGSVVMDKLSNATEDALKHANYVNIYGPATEDGNSIVAGSINAAVVHVNSGVGQTGLKNPASLVVKNSTLSTMPEDVMSTTGHDMTFVDMEDYLLNPIKDQGASWFYLQYSKGSLVFARSAGIDVTFGEGAVLKPANGVLVHSAIGYDSDAGNIYNDSSLRIADKISHITVNLDTPVVGDIVHDDYQRYLYLNVNADYSGAVTSGTIDTWNNLWSDASLEAMLEAAGYTASDFSVAANGDVIRKNLIRETKDYPVIYGSVVKLADGVKWTVTDNCSMSSLTIGEGSQLVLPEGFSVYVDCGSDYSYLSGKKLDALEPGVEYKMVVIACNTGYSDVKSTDSYAEAVMKVTEAGLMNGFGDCFKPNEYLTVAQAVKLAVIADQMTANGSITPLAADAGEMWYQPYVDYALETGIIYTTAYDWNAAVTKGDFNAMFGADFISGKHANRWEAAAYLCRILGL